MMESIIEDTPKCYQPVARVYVSFLRRTSLGLGEKEERQKENMLDSFILGLKLGGEIDLSNGEFAAILLAGKCSEVESKNTVRMMRSNRL